MIYKAFLTETVAIQRKDHYFQTFPIISHWSELDVPIHSRYYAFKPIGPTILVEWEDG